MSAASSHYDNNAISVLYFFCKSVHIGGNGTIGAFVAMTITLTLLGESSRMSRLYVIAAMCYIMRTWPGHIHI